MIKPINRNFAILTLTIIGVGIIISLYWDTPINQPPRSTDKKTIAAKRTGGDDASSIPENQQLPQKLKIPVQDGETAVTTNDNLAPVYNAGSQFSEGKEPYFWNDFASMRQSAVRDPNSPQNRATIKAIRNKRKMRLSAVQDARNSRKDQMEEEKK